MSFVITPVTELPPPAPSASTTPQSPTSSKARITLDVEIPESARSFADLVVKANGFRREARMLVAAPQGSLRGSIVATAPHAVPVAVGIALCLFAGIGEGLAGAMALWGGLRSALPARPGGSPLSGKTAELVRDRATQAALGLDQTGIATLRYAAAATLEEARAVYGLTPAAELVAQSLAFRQAESPDCDDTARRAAAAAEALLPRGYSGGPAGSSLDEVGTYEALALVDRRESITQHDYHANHVLSQAEVKARGAIDRATMDTVRRLVRAGDESS